MANYYASSLAGGGGSGTIGSPFTFAGVIAHIAASGVAGDIYWIKADGTYNIAQYTITKNGTNGATFRMEGYTTTPGDGGMAVLLRSGGSGQLAGHSATYWSFKNISWDAGGLGTACLGSTSSQYYINCRVRRGGTLGSNGGGHFVSCLFENNGLYGSAVGNYFNCQAINNGTFGFYNPIILDHCVAANNGSYGVSLANYCSIVNSVINANSGGGVTTTAPVVIIKNTIISNHGSGHGINFGFTADSLCYGCDFWNNTSNTNIPANLLFPKYIDPQYTNAIGMDFRRAGSSLDGQGYGIIGMNPGINYEMAIGPSPKVTGGSALPTFAGITSLAAAAEGCLIAGWAAGTNVLHYEVYIKAATDTGLFDAANKVLDIDALSPGRLSAKIKTTGDGTTLLDTNTTYFVGVRAENSFGIETNTVSLSAIPSDNINAVVSQIKSKTDRMQFDASDNIKSIKNATDAPGTDWSDLEISRLGTGAASQASVDAIKAELDTVKAKTDNLPAQPADEVTSQSILAFVQNIGLSNRIADTIPASLIIPGAVTPVKFNAWLKDTIGNQVDPFDNQLSFILYNQLGVRSDHGFFYADQALTTQLIDGPASLDNGALTIREGLGVYSCYAAMSPLAEPGNYYVVYQWYDTDPLLGGVKQTTVKPFAILDDTQEKEVLGDDIIGTVETETELTGAVDISDVFGTVEIENEIIGAIEEK